MPKLAFRHFGSPICRHSAYRHFGRPKCRSRQPRTQQ